VNRLLISFLVSKRPGRRHAFTVAFDGHVDFYDGRVGVAPTIALGYDAF
jgi:hypothetical protein